MILLSHKPYVLIAIPVLLNGGTEFQTLALVRSIVADKYRVMVCCYYEFDETVVKLFKEAGTEILLLRLNRSDDRFGPFNIFKLILKLIATIRKYCPDIVHIQYLAPGLIPIIAARLSGVKIVFATVHQPGRPYGLKAKLLLRFGAFLCTAFFCVSKSVEESWFGTSSVLDPNNINPKRNHFTIYNSIDEPYISKIAKSINPNNLKKDLGIDTCPVIGIVGRIRVEKGHSILLDAMIEVMKKVPTAKLLVVGDGPDRLRLENKADSLGISKTVIWMGNKTREEVFKLYVVMDIVVVPSLFEGFGLSAAEAMAASRPIVASAVDGLNEIIHHGVTGYLIPLGDDKTLAKYILELISNPIKAKAMGKAGHQKVVKDFSQQRYAQSILSAYRYFT